MIRSSFVAGLALSLLPINGWATGPKVVVDIAPLHSIVAEVMNGVGEPALLIEPEASPHSYSLRPSEAEALAEADAVFWIGEGLTPWLEKSLDTLAGDAQRTKMMAVEATTTHSYREGATFGTHDHDHHHHHHGKDPHAWLDPMNAKIWAGEIVRVLAAIDSSNTEVYQQNAEAFAESMDGLMASLDERATRLDGTRFIVFHDAYQYFERRFDLPAAGAISISDASDPSPARIREIQGLVSELGVTCAFAEPQFNPGLLDTVFEGSEVRTIGVMDPLGVEIDVGLGQYPTLIMQLMSSLEKCQ